MSTDEVRLLEKQLGDAEMTLTRIQMIVAAVPETKRTLTVQKLIADIQQALAGDDE